jgi:hypothetical protein
VASSPSRHHVLRLPRPGGARYPCLMVLRGSRGASWPGEPVPGDPARELLPRSRRCSVGKIPRPSDPPPSSARCWRPRRSPGSCATACAAGGRASLCDAPGDSVPWTSRTPACNGVWDCRTSHASGRTGRDRIDHEATPGCARDPRGSGPGSWSADPHSHELPHSPREGRQALAPSTQRGYVWLACRGRTASSVSSCSHPSPKSYSYRAMVSGRGK